jgi:hypothetical protein
MCADLRGNVEWLTADDIVTCVVYNRNTIVLQFSNQEVAVRSILSNEWLAHKAKIAFIFVQM